MAMEAPAIAKAPVPIRQFGDPVLRMRAAEVAHDEIGSAQVASLIEDMVASLRAAGGIGLAAPQIGVSQRVLIIKIPALTRIGYGNVPETPLLAMINPRIVSTSEETRRAPEACLSIRTPDGRGVYEGVLERPERVTIQGLGRDGSEIVVDADNLLARALQHEVDHLDGILFTDRIRDLKDLRVYYPVVASDPVLEQNTFVTRD